MVNCNSSFLHTDRGPTPLVTIPEGTIHLRDDRKNHEWDIAIEPFLLGTYPVTQELYNSVTKSAPSTFKGDTRPVETVSWMDAVAFCNLLSEVSGLEPYYTIFEPDKTANCNSSAKSYRLPTEAEWEYACKAGCSKPRYGELDAVAWYKDNSGNQTHEVGSKEPNAWGLYDMLGNVWEWCWDIYDPEVYGSYRVFRGGGWADRERGCLATNRRRSHPTFAIDDLGFRVAMSL